jgi:glucose-6-phosphate 1-dehydrogenase
MAAIPLNLVIFGASGDLTARKLIPSLYNLDRKKRLPEELRIVGVARRPFSDDAFRAKLAPAAREFVKGEWTADSWNAFARRIHYVQGDGSEVSGLEALRAWLEKGEGGAPAEQPVATEGSIGLRSERQGGRRLFYLSVAPELYEPIITNLTEARLATPAKQGPEAWRRLIIEKPFGRDQASARKLNAVVQSHFREDQVYRIDHYLGKETVQNVLVFRFANTLFEPVWNNNYIDHVQITASEAVTVEERGGYYDHSGVLRDMFQNHLLQLLTLVAMEAPARFAADPLRNEKVKVLDAIPVYSGEEAAGRLVTGQYAGYLSAKGVAPQSRTPTFAAVELAIDNWRWRGVPFFLRSGKAMGQRLSEIVIQFRCPPHLMFPLPPGTTLQCNRLSICVQPDEGIHLNFQSKVPDREAMLLKPTDLEFHYKTAYPDAPIPEAYERLLHDAINGDASLFMRADELDKAWEIMDPLIAAAETGRVKPAEYPVGSPGPRAADEFLARSGRAWLSLCHH